MADPTPIDEMLNNLIEQSHAEARGGNGVASYVVERYIHPLALVLKDTRELARRRATATPSSDASEALVAGMRADNYRLTRNLETHKALEVRRVGMLEERGRQVAALTAEIGTLKAKVVETERATVSAIADHLEWRASEIVESTGGSGYTRAAADANQRAAGLTDAVDALRAGTWKEQG